MKSKPKIPKDLGLVMGTVDERNWRSVLDGAKSAVKEAEFTIKLQSAVIEVAEDKIKVEQETFKQNQKV